MKKLRLKIWNLVFLMVNKSLQADENKFHSFYHLVAFQIEKFMLLTFLVLFAKVIISFTLFSGKPQVKKTQI